MANRKQILADIETINAVEVRFINGVEMFEISQLEKVFNRTLDNWFEQPYTREYMKALSFVMYHQRNRGKTSSAKAYAVERLKMVEEMAIRRADGRWVCRELFIEFARWLSPYFAVKCNLFCEPLVPKIVEQG